MSEYEAILKKIKPFGPFQIRTFLLVSLFETPLAWAMLVPVFTAANPGFLCLFQKNETSELITNSSAEANSCQQNGSMCTEIQFETDFTSIVTEWKFICDQKYKGELITSVQMAGVLIGAVITGQLADVFGRKEILFSEYTLLIIIWFSTAFSPSWEIYAALRFFVGGLVGGCLVVNFVLPLEFVTPSWRTLCGCIGFWAVGLMTLSPWAYFIRDWRMLNIAMSLSSLVLLPLWWFIHESPRWLLSRGRLMEAKVILVKAAKFNKQPVPDMTPLQDFVKREQIMKAMEKKYSYWHLFGTSWRLTKGTIICMYGWLVSSAVYYGHNFNSKNLAGDRYLNFFLSGLVEIPALLFVLWANNKFGRRKTTCLLMLVAGLACVSILIIDLTGKLEELSALTITMAMIGKSCIAGGWAAVQIFSAETFPTIVRNIGIGACSMAARVGAIVAPQFVILGQSSKPVPFTIFGVLALSCSILMLFLQETVDTPLPDILRVTQDSPMISLQEEVLIPSLTVTDKTQGIITDKGETVPLSQNGQGSNSQNELYEVDKSLDV